MCFTLIWPYCLTGHKKQITYLAWLTWVQVATFICDRDQTCVRSWCHFYSNRITRYALCVCVYVHHINSLHCTCLVYFQTTVLCDPVKGWPHPAPLWSGIEPRVAKCKCCFLHSASEFVRECKRLHHSAGWCLSVSATFQLPRPVYVAQLTSTLDAGEFSVPPNPGLLAFLHQRHRIDLHHRVRWDPVFV